MHTIASKRNWMFVLMLLVVACHQKTDKKDIGNEKYFEGVVTYKITYSSNNKDGPIYGDTMRMYYSNGNVMKTFNGTSPQRLKRELFLGASNSYYMEYGGSDTLLSFDISTNPIQLVNSSQTDHAETILAYDCNSIEQQGVHTGRYKYYVYGKYSFSPNVLRVDKKFFKHWNYSNYSNYMNEAGVLYLKCESKIQDYPNSELLSKTYEAIDIKQTTLDSSIFHVDPTKVKVFVGF